MEKKQYESSGIQMFWLLFTVVGVGVSFVLALTSLWSAYREGANEPHYSIFLVSMTSLIWLSLWGAHRYRQTLPLTQKLEAANLLLENFVAWEEVEDYLSRRAREAEHFFKLQAEALSRRGLHSEGDDEQHRRLEGEVVKSKRRFWQFHGAAKLCGYEVEDRISDYLTVDPQDVPEV